MKFSLLSVVAVIALLSFAYAEEDIKVYRRFLTCDSILAVKVCDKFRTIGNKIQVKASEIETFVTDAYNKGITKAEEIKSYVEKELETRVLSKSCEELTGKVFCEKLDTISSYLKKKSDELKPYIVKAIMEGKEKAIDIKNQVEDYIKNDLMKKTCTDILTVDQCNKIDKIGTDLTLKTEAIKKALVDSIMQGYNKVTITVTQTFTNMKKAAENFTCEELLNPNLCVTLREYAQKFKIAVPKLMNAVRSAIVMGYKGTKGFITVVYKISDAFIDCEHFLSHENCEKIKAQATKIGAKITEISKAIKEAVTKGITEATKIYKSTIEFLKSKFGRKRRSLAEKLNLKERLQKYKELLKKHAANADKFLKDIIKGLTEKYKELDEKIREAVKIAITQGKIKYDKIKEYIEELIQKRKDGQSIDKRDVTSSLSIRDTLKKALTKATGFTRMVIQTFLGWTNDKLHKYTRKIQKVLDSILGEDKKRDVDSQLLDAASKQLVKERFDQLANDLNNDIEKLITEVADETDQLISDVVKSESKRNKRFLDFDLKDFKLADYVLEVLKSKVNILEEKIVEKSSALLKEIKEALAKAGTKMTDVSKIVLEKTNEFLKDLQA